MEKIFIEGAKVPAGHYSPGVKTGNMIYVSGQLPIDPFTGEKSTGDIKEQTLRTLDNVRLVLESAGSCLEKIVKANIYIPDVAMWDEVNAVFKGYFGEHKPARVIIPTRELHYGLLIEIDAIAEA